MAICQKDISEAETKIYVGVPNTGLTMIEFYSDKCKFCNQMKPLYAKLSKKYSNAAKFYKINIDNYRDTYFVKNTPTYMVYLNENRQIVAEGAMTFEKLEAVFQAGFLKNALYSKTVDLVKEQVSSGELILKSWNHFMERIREAKNDGSNNKEFYINLIDSREDLNNGVLDGASITIGDVQYKIIENPESISIPEEWEWPSQPGTFQSDLKRVYKNAANGTFTSRYEGDLWPKIEDGYAVEIKYNDADFDAPVVSYLCFAIDILSGQYVPLEIFEFFL